MKPNRGDTLSPEEKQFISEYLETANAMGSWKRAFPDDRSPSTEKALTFINKPHVQAYVAFLELPPDEKAAVVLEQTMLTGDMKQAVAAAKQMIDLQERVSQKGSLGVWLEEMRKVGAQVAVDKPGTVSLDMLFSGEARIKIPLEPSSDFLNEPEHPGTN